MATELKSYINSHRRTLASLQARERKLTKGQKLEFARKYAAKIAAAEVHFSQDVAGCGSNKDVLDAIKLLSAIKTP